MASHACALTAVSSTIQCWPAPRCDEDDDEYEARWAKGVWETETFQGWFTQVQHAQTAIQAARLLHGVSAYIASHALVVPLDPSWPGWVAMTAGSMSEFQD